jgi:hypothetical protein
MEFSPVQTQKQSLQGLGIGFAETIRDSMFRRDVHPGYVQQVGIIQTRRKGYRDPRNFYPLQINVPTDASLTDITNCFENPRKAPHPQGPKYNPQPSNYPPSLSDITGRHSMLNSDNRPQHPGVRKSGTSLNIFSPKVRS